MSRNMPKVNILLNANTIYTEREAGRVISPDGPAATLHAIPVCSVPASRRYPVIEILQPDGHFILIYNIYAHLSQAADFDDTLLA